MFGDMDIQKTYPIERLNTIQHEKMNWNALEGEESFV